jgi:voltage-gated sodium channel
MVQLCKNIADSPRFQLFITAVIVANAILLGVETSKPIMADHGFWLKKINWILQGIFVLELLIRLTAHAPRFGSFFKNGWNVFDFVIVTVSLLPINGEFANIGRLLRLMRILRLVSVAPQLRLIISTMLTSIPSMGHVVLLLGMLLYIYGIAGYYLFSDVDPLHWGTLGKSVLSMFQIVTLEGWADMQATLLPERPFAWVFFGSFIVIGVFVTINLFIAVVINNLEEAKAAEQRKADAADPEKDILVRLDNLKDQLAELDRVVRDRVSRL